MSSPADQPALPAGARVRPGGGRDVLVVDTQTVRAEVSLDGGQLISWSPSGQEDLLWLSPLARSGAGEAVRGGIPWWPRGSGPDATGTAASRTAGCALPPGQCWRPAPRARRSCWSWYRPAPPPSSARI